MILLYIYLGFCLAIFGWYMLLGVRDFLFQPPYKNEYESFSFGNRHFWREALWYSFPVVNLFVFALFVYIVAIGYKDTG